MIDNIDSILQQECNLHLGDLLLIGVSGGPDSLCLLNILYKLGYSVIVAHVNHRLRPEADAEADIVAQYTRSLGLVFYSSEVDVPSYAQEHSIPIEEAARRLRYRFLFTQARSLGASAVVVGHTADDQVETVLMHLLRGSGLSGARGMDFRALPNAWSDRIPLVRPLLATWRSEINNYLSENLLTPVSDQSNLDTTYFRNRLRLELLPSLERYNPRIRENLLRTGQLMRDDYTVIQQLVDAAWDSLLAHQGTDYLAFHLAGFSQLPKSIQRNLLRKAIDYYLPGLRDIDFECIERARGLLLAAKSNSRVDLMAGICLIKEYELFWVTTRTIDLPVDEYPLVKRGVQLTLRIGSTLFLENNWQLQADEAADLTHAYHQSLGNHDPFQAWMDAGEIKLPLIVRSRNTGERFQPLGMNGRSTKLSDLLINLKLPKRARDTWPLVCSGEDILWVPGCRRSQLAQVTPASRQVIHLSLSRLSSG